jgi:hypothetical protein
VEELLSPSQPISSQAASGHIPGPVAQERGINRGGARVATKWVSGYFAKYETERNKTFFRGISAEFREIPRKDFAKISHIFAKYFC